MTLREKIRLKVLGMLGLVNTSENGSGTKPDVDRDTLINDSEAVKLAKLKEYNIWYYGDEEELLNFYTYNNLVEYNYEPYYSRNKRSYFWSISSTETDIKRTHSGQPRNIIDTITNIMRFPLIDCKNKISEELLKLGKDQKSEDGKDIDLSIHYNPVNDTLHKIIAESELESLYKHKQVPLTLVEGWGCYKINWDKNVSDYPYAVYYRAENVDFIYGGGNRIIGCVFRDYYTDGNNKNYLLVETRSLKYDEENQCRNLVIEKELFKITSPVSGADHHLTPVDFSEVPELTDVEKYIEIGPLDFLLAVPSVFFANTQDVGMHGRSVFTGKIALFDDLDQCLSQAANTIRRSTVHEYFNVDFLERDTSTGMPKQPKAFDRKYTMYMGSKSADGSSTGNGQPVQVTQPQLNVDQYNTHAKELLMQIINGVISPATLGIDIAKKDNAEAQREKEKVTIFTRNAIIDIETKILKSLCNQLLCAYEFMWKGKITVLDYDISVKFSEFADDSFENKLEKLSAAYNSTTISDEMFMKKLYGDTLSRAEFDTELEWLRKHHTEPKDEGMKGIAGGGDNLEGMFGGDEIEGIENESEEDMMGYE